MATETNPMNGGNGGGNGRDPLVSFSKLPPAMPMPNLLDVQVRAFQTLLETDKSIEERQTAVANRLGFEIRDHSLILYGHCRRADCPNRKPRDVS